MFNQPMRDSDFCPSGFLVPCYGLKLNIYVCTLGCVSWYLLDLISYLAIDFAYSAYFVLTPVASDENPAYSLLSYYSSRLPALHFFMPILTSITSSLVFLHIKTLRKSSITEDKIYVDQSQWECINFNSRGNQESVFPKINKHKFYTNICHLHRQVCQKINM